MDTHMFSAYKSLLADVSRITGIPLDLPYGDDTLRQWIIIDGPALDKQLIRLLGDVRPSDLADYANGIVSDDGSGWLHDWPQWIIPLVRSVLVDLSHSHYGTCGEEASTLRHLRTLLTFCYKTEHAPTKQQLSQAQDAFCEVEEGVRCWDSTFNSANPGRYYSFARQLISRVLSKGTRDELLTEITPSHGPGAVFPRKEPRLKSNFATVYPSIERWYPFDRWFQRIFIDELCSPARQDFLYIAPNEQIICKMVAVAKDSRGPRLICVHPSESIYIQQGQRRWLEGLIASHHSTREHIQFTDQVANGDRALISSSRIQGFATLDLKEASDRVSSKLVDYLFGGFSDILSCTRATHVQLLDRSVVELRKWAPMGNCLTFPVESLLFWALCTAAICVDAKAKASDANVYVFGDDIQYPSEYNDVVVRRLVSAGLVPNASKTFVNGSFKESCGVDAFMGFDVTPLRLRKLDPSSVLSAIAFCDLAKRAGKRGYSRLSARLYDAVRQYYPVSYTNNDDAVGLFEYINVDLAGLLDFVQPSGIRFNRRFHRWETKGLLPVASVKMPLHTRWCVVDSLNALELRDKDRTLGRQVGLDAIESDFSPLERFWVTNSLDKRVRYTTAYASERDGLVYSDPDRVRLVTGWTPVTTR